MLERLRVENYQSIGEVDLLLGEFVVVVGPTGRGKSALIRALTALCFNQTGGSFVRHGQRKATVTLTFDGGRMVEWSKPREGGATYVLDGQEYTRVGRSVPEDVEKALAIRRIEVDKGIAWRPQFQQQHDLPLLLTETASMAARTLAKLTKLQVLVEAQVACRRDKQRAERAVTGAAEEVGRLKEQLAGLPSVKRAQGSMDRAKKLLRASSERLEIAESASRIVEDIAGSLLLADITLPSDEQVAAVGERLVTLEQAVAGADKLRRARSSVEMATEAVEAAAEKLEHTQDEHDALVEELGVCPMCGSAEMWGKSGTPPQKTRRRGKR